MITKISVKNFNRNEAAAWDSYVRAHEDGSFFHLSGWQTVLDEGLGHKTYYCYAESNNQIVGVLPLAQVKSLLFGNALVSTPFCVVGGALANTFDIARILENHAKQLAEKLAVDYLELRGECHDKTGFVEKNLYVSFKKTIDSDNEKNLSAIPRKQRAMVRKGIKNDLQGEWDNSLQRFYRAYSESVRNLGTPIFPKKFFNVLWKVFGEESNILTITHQQQLIASVLSFHYADQIMPYYGGGVAAARAFKGNDFMYWELMRRSADQGMRIFDYGRSKKGTGSYSFKKNWGFEPEELPYYYYLVKAKQIPDLNPLNPKYQLFIKMWRKLPLPLANFLGPFLARNLG